MSPLDDAPNPAVDRGPARAAVDNVIRRALKISDPRNPDEVAKGLLARYSDEAQRIDREKQGLPFTVLEAVRAGAPMVGDVGLARDMRMATDVLDLSLSNLTTDPDLADIAPELRGWSAVIRRAAADGFDSARHAVDAGQRDRAFGARRTLGDYARLARYAGAVTQCSTDTYCRVAQACDLAANVILVSIGDTLGAAGITRSGAIPQVSAPTIQARRDAVLAALHNLLHPMPGDSQDSEPRATAALLQIEQRLENIGAPDLRAVLDEMYLSQRLDALVDMASGASPDGLRALGSAAATTVALLRRFVSITRNAPVPDSPPATSFFTQVDLFVQSFEGGRSGYRLPFLARSPLLVSNFTAGTGIDPPTRVLLDLALRRTALADAVDCLCCTCERADARELVLAGNVLANLDQAINQYSLGNTLAGGGPAEQRAAAYGRLIANVLLLAGAAQFKALTAPALNPIAAALGAPPFGILVEVFLLARADEARWAQLVSAMAPSCRRDLLPI